jgi:hypothetical protein
VIPQFKSKAATTPSGKEIPLGLSVGLGVLVLCLIFAVVWSMRAKRTEAQAQAQASSTPQAAAPPSVANDVRPVAPRAPMDSVVVHRVVHPASSSSAGKTAERQAVDALHLGDPRAAALYRELAAAHPENAALVDTARMLSAAPRAQ